MADLSKLDIRLAVTDAPVGDTAEMLKCTQHQDDAESLAVYRDGLHCFGCGFHLATLTGLAYLLYGAWDKAAMTRALQVHEKYTAQSLDAYRERVTVNTKTDPLHRSLASAYASLLWNTRHQRIEYLLERGLGRETIRQFYLGHDGTRFVIPIYDKDHRLLTFRFRRDDLYGTSYFDARRGQEVALPKYAGLRGRNGLYLYPEWEIEVAEPDYLVVVEGELDAIRLWQEGIPAVSTTNGAGNVHRIPAMLRETFPSINRLFIATDQDAPGDTASQQTYQTAKDLGFTVSSLRWLSEWGKDVTELYLNGHSLEETIVYGDEHALPLHRD